MSDVMILCDKPCIRINGVNFVHHSNGGGLKAVTAQVDNSVYLGPFVIVKSNAKIIGNEIRISGNVEIPSNVEISGNNISIFGYGHLRFSKGFYKSNIDIHGSGRWNES